MLAAYRKVPKIEPKGKNPIKIKFNFHVVVLG